MSRYQWTGRTRAGQVVTGEQEAGSREALARALRRDEILLTCASKARWPLQRRARPRSLAVFTRQLSVMVDAGLPLVQCLDLLSREEPDKRLSAATTRVRLDVEAGASLAEAMSRQPYAFDTLYTSMVAAGEAGGMLDAILKRVAVFIEQQARLVSQVRSAFLYPLSVIGVASVVVLVILWKVVPAFTTLFAGLNAPLPLPTRIVIATSRGLIVSVPFLVAAAVATSVLARRYYATHEGRTRIDGLALGVPLIGPTVRKVAVARFCRTLSALVGAGVPILEGLEITATSSGNAVVEAALREVRRRIEGGDTVAQPLRATGVFPPMVSQMIGAGESTGALEPMLAKIAEFYEEEVEVAIASLLKLVEPALISLLGVIVGGVVIALYLPLFDIISRLS